MPGDDLEHAVRTGEPAFARVHDTDPLGHLETHPDDAAVFDGAMQDIAGSFLAGILVVYDFSGYTTLVDVGGGTGALLAPRRWSPKPNRYCTPPGSPTGASGSRGTSSTRCRRQPTSTS
ncbi:methyltransferase [Geodermatophilus sp. CPCC 205506]|uniref:methyltransferase n=1 Tax=Geodermatophilus sp. CPCC 205506 TaxID=2936596 RepID=UPI003EEF362D